MQKVIFDMRTLRLKSNKNRCTVYCGVQQAFDLFYTKISSSGKLSLSSVVGQETGRQTWNYGWKLKDVLLSAASGGECCDNPWSCEAKCSRRNVYRSI